MGRGPLDDRSALPMHSYNTRFRSMNRSFAASGDNDEYVPSHNVSSGGRRPVTRSMTRALATAPRRAVHATEAPSARPVTRSMVAAPVQRPVTRSMTAGRATQIARNALAAARSGSTHPMTLRSARR